MHVLRNTTLILHQLRLLMEFYFESGMLDAYIIPSSDAHHNIRIAECDQRRAFVSGFDGSAGTAIVTNDEALLWTDGRYFIQASAQLDENWQLMKEGIEGVPSQAEWLVKNLSDNATIGVDPEQYSKVEWDAMSKSLKQGGKHLVPVENLIDKIWLNRPDRSINSIVQLPMEYAGQSVQDKIINVRQALIDDRADVLIISEMDEVAWLLNLRGSDLPLAPVFFSYVILTTFRVDIFLHLDSTDSQIIVDLQNEIKNVTFFEYENVYERLSVIAEEHVYSDGKFWMSRNGNSALARLIPEDKLSIKLTPIAVMKAVKNPIEVMGMRNAFVRDSAVVSIFYAWLVEAMNNGENLTEVSAANKLYEFRSQAENFVSLSFKTISGSGPNAAIVHYFPTNETDRRLSKDEMLLVDSGAHYLDGTTDGTRTFHFNNPTDYQKDCYTRVLKGQIAMAKVTFPRLVTGHTIDGFARRFLWEVGLDYAHGTGHGIGAYLNVGEGPQSVSYTYNEDDPGLRENMIVSNEPGFYSEGNFGIRLENALRIVNSSNSNFLTMEDLIFVPYQRSLIKVELLTDKEIEYLNGYFKKCREITGKYLVDHPELGGVDNTNAINWIWQETQEI